MPVRWFSPALAVAGLAVMAGMVTPTLGDGKPRKSAAETGKTYGLALSATAYCPGGVLTDKGKAFALSYTGKDAAAFKAESETILEAWGKGTRCNIDEMDPRQFSMCAIMRKRNCQALWAQIGPGGSVVPDLIDIDYSTLE